MLPVRGLICAVKQNSNSLKYLQLNLLRHGSYFTSKLVGDPSKYTDYEITKNPEEWKYVERLFVKPRIPTPKPKDSYPSGWTPQTVDPEKCTWFVHRNKAHMMPVYLDISERGMRRLTKIKKVDGDIWAFYKELKPWLEMVNPGKILGIKVNEVQQEILIHGDHVNQCRRFLLDRGF
nr:PREDICTED: probable 39S ribosomal protein L49, mitochondrial [Bemisia tabaci]